MAQDTAVEIIQRVSAECGLPVPTTPFSSSNPNDALLITLLNSAGDELVGTYAWPSLDRTLECNFATSGGEGSFLLPPDWGYIHPQTVWNTTTNQPVFGPLTAQQWAQAENSLSGGLTPLSMSFRQIGPAIEFMPTTADTSTVITLGYTSSYWVMQSLDSIYTDAVTLPDDTVLFDGQLISRLLKLRWLEAKKFDTGAASAEFRAALDSAIRKARGSGPVLNLQGGSVYQPSQIGILPDTGFGS